MFICKPVNAKGHYLLQFLGDADGHQETTCCRQRVEHVASCGITMSTWKASQWSSAGEAASAAGGAALTGAGDASRNAAQPSSWLAAAGACAAALTAGACMSHGRSVTKSFTIAYSDNDVQVTWMNPESPHGKMLLS